MNKNIFFIAVLAIFSFSAHGAEYPEMGELLEKASPFPEEVFTAHQLADASNELVKSMLEKQGVFTSNAWKAKHKLKECTALPTAFTCWLEFQNNELSSLYEARGNLIRAAKAVIEAFPPEAEMVEAPTILPLADEANKFVEDSQP